MDSTATVSIGASRASAGPPSRRCPLPDATHLAPAAQLSRPELDRLLLRPNLQDYIAEQLAPEIADRQLLTPQRFERALHAAVRSLRGFAEAMEAGAKPRRRSARPLDSSPRRRICASCSTCTGVPCTRGRQTRMVLPVAQRTALGQCVSLETPPSESSVLPGHTAEAAAPTGPRNPLLRALSRFGSLLARKFAAALPTRARVLTPTERAAAQTRTQLGKVFERLLAAEAKSRKLAANRSLAARPQKLAAEQRKLSVGVAADLHKLAQARGHWTDRDPNAAQQFGQAVREVLDAKWPAGDALKLAAAMRCEPLAAAQLEMRHDPHTDRTHNSRRNSRRPQ